MAQTIQYKPCWTVPSAGPLYPPLTRDNATEIIAKAERRLEVLDSLETKAKDNGFQESKLCQLLEKMYNFPIPSLDWFVDNCNEAVTIASTVTPMELHDWQRPHFEFLLKCLQIYRFYADVSQMGLGKTVVSCMLAKTLGLDLVVVGPLTVEHNWNRTAYRCDVKLLGFFTYEGLRSTKDHQPKHGLLYRRDDPNTIFTPTDLFKFYVEKGILLIFDEFQKEKNESAQAHACQALSREIVTGKGSSRVGFLSGTPFDKEEHAVAFYRATGMLTEKNLNNWEIKNKSMDYRGLTEIYKNMRIMFANHPSLINVDRDYRDIITQQAKKKHCQSVLYRWLVEIITKACFSGMSAPKIDFPLDIKSGYYWAGEQAKIVILGYFNEMAEIIAKNIDRVTLTINKEALKAICKLMELIEIEMAPTFARVAKIILDRNPKAKVPIFLQYHKSMDIVLKELEDYHPLSLNGKIPGKKRQGIIQKFQYDSDCRVIVAQILVGGIGVDLHDTIGDHPRYVLMSPDYKTIPLHQAVYRVHRVGIKSPAFVRMVFAEGCEGYRNVLNALARKAVVLGELTPEQVNAGIKYPGEYDRRYERPVDVTELADTAIFGDQHASDDVIAGIMSFKI